MPEGELKSEIEALGVKCGFPLNGVFVIDGSKRSTKANAFFTGFGKHKKIALFDTLTEKSTTPELLAILAHEIGHFRLGHIKQRLFVGILQMALIFFLIGLATNPGEHSPAPFTTRFSSAEFPRTQAWYFSPSCWSRLRNSFPSWRTPGRANTSSRQMPTPPKTPARPRRLPPPSKSSAATTSPTPRPTSSASSWTTHTHPFSSG